jgi:hypothetical protein
MQFHDIDLVHPLGLGQVSRFRREWLSSKCHLDKFYYSPPHILFLWIFALSPIDVDFLPLFHFHLELFLFSFYIHYLCFVGVTILTGHLTSTSKSHVSRIVTLREHIRTYTTLQVNTCSLVVLLVKMESYSPSPGSRKGPPVLVVVRC